jgi:hypothetical protein
MYSAFYIRSRLTGLADCQALAKKAVFEYGLSRAETARHLGVTSNAVSYMLGSK